jgi:hypothetical protein
LFIAPPPQSGYDRPEKLRTATACFIEENTISVLKLPANHTVTFGSKNEGTVISVDPTVLNGSKRHWRGAILKSLALWFIYLGVFALTVAGVFAYALLQL